MSDELILARHLADLAGVPLPPNPPYLRSLLKGLGFWDWITVASPQVWQLHVIATTSDEASAAAVLQISLKTYRGMKPLASLSDVSEQQAKEIAATVWDDIMAFKRAYDSIPTKKIGQWNVVIAKKRKIRFFSRALEFKGRGSLIVYNHKIVARGVYPPFSAIEDLAESFSVTQIRLKPEVDPIQAIIKMGAAKWLTEQNSLN